MKQFRWKAEDDKVLLSIFEKKNKERKWKIIAKEFTALTGKQVKPKQCAERYLNYLDPKLNLGPFSANEDERIMKLVNEKGKMWMKIAIELKTGRSGASVKNRYHSIRQRKPKPTTPKKAQKAKGTPERAPKVQLPIDIEQNVQLLSEREQEVPIVQEIEVPLRFDIFEVDTVEKYFLDPPEVGGPFARLAASSLPPHPLEF